MERNDVRTAEISLDLDRLNTEANYLSTILLIISLLKSKHMFDQILQMVKEHLGNKPQVTSNLPSEQQDEMHNEVATQITNGLANHATTQGGVGGLLDSLKNAATSGSPIAGAIEGVLHSSDLCACRRRFHDRSPGRVQTEHYRPFSGRGRSRCRAFQGYVHRSDEAPKVQEVRKRPHSG